MADDVDRVPPRIIERVDQVGDVLADRPRSFEGRAAVPAQVDGERATLGPCLLGKAAEASAMGGDAVHGEQRFALGAPKRWVWSTDIGTEATGRPVRVCRAGGR